MTRTNTAPLRGAPPGPLLFRGRAVTAQSTSVYREAEGRLGTSSHGKQDCGVWRLPHPGVTYAVTPLRSQGLLLSDLLMSGVHREKP